MPDFAKMYRRLFNSQTDAIHILQQAQQDTEEMFTAAPEPDFRVWEQTPPNEADDGPEKK